MQGQVAGVYISRTDYDAYGSDHLFTEKKKGALHPVDAVDRFAVPDEADMTHPWSKFKYHGARHFTC